VIARYSPSTHEWAAWRRVPGGTDFELSNARAHKGVFVTQRPDPARDIAAENFQRALAAEREAFKRYLASGQQTSWLEKRRWELKRAQREQAAAALAAERQRH
jgi:hypothetical protein